MTLQKRFAGWYTVCAVYLSFIFIFSFLYPLGVDEYYGYGFGLKESAIRAIITFWAHSPKIGVFIGGVLLYFGNWLFVILNPLVQLGIVLGIFYFVNLRLPDFGNYKDMPAFVLIALLSIFAVPMPSNTLFWIGGSVNYSWPFLFFLFFLCAARALYENKPLFRDSFLNCFFIFILAVCLGLSNENNSPMALALSALFFILLRLKKIKLPKWIYFAFAGIAFGFGLMFLSPALARRAAEMNVGFMHFPVKAKLFFHINHFHYFILGNMLIFVFNILGLMICAIDRRNKPFVNSNFILAGGCAAISFALFFVLFITPYVGGRNYYSAAMFSIIAFLFLLAYIKETYGPSLIRYCAAAAFIYAAVSLPLFSIPYVNLYKQSCKREEIISEALKKGKTIAYLPYYIVVSGGSVNNDILFFDVMYATPYERALYLKINAVPIRLLPEQPYQRSSFHSYIL
jgi:hypothetical protein